MKSHWIFTNKVFIATVITTAVLGIASLAAANEVMEKKGKFKAPRREMGMPVGHNHIIVHSGKEEIHPVISDHRPLAAVHNDHNIIRMRPRAFLAIHIDHRWDHWHRDWGVFWRFAAWDRISQVTCEAVNTGNNYLYPVTGYRTEWGTTWSNDSANQIAENALDQCYAESESIGANPDNCVLVDWECRPTYL